MFALAIGLTVLAASHAALYDKVFVKLTRYAEHQGSAVLQNGDAVTAGYTGGVVGLAAFGQEDFLVQRYNTAGSLIWNHQSGTSAKDVLLEVTTDSDSNIYAGGYTKGSYDGHVYAGGSDCVLIKLDSFGNKVFTLQFGGSGDDEIKYVALDETRGVLYVTGFTSSPVLNGVTRKQNHESESYVTKVNATSGAILAHFNIPHGSVHTQSVAVDSAGYLWVGGWTTSSTYYGVALTGGPFTFAQQFDMVGKSLKISMVKGAGNYGMTADSNDNKYSTGDVHPEFYGQPTAGGQDIYVAKFNSTGGREWVKTFGGTGNELGGAIAVDSASGRVYVTGRTASPVFYGKPNPTGDNSFLLVLSAVDGSLLHVQLYASATTSVGHSIATRGSQTYFVGRAWGESFQGQASSGADGFIVCITTSFVTASPTAAPTAPPTKIPTAKPSANPTAKPFANPTTLPSSKPVIQPTMAPTALPTADPTVNPTALPTTDPTVNPSALPTAEPTVHPTALPTAKPSANPTALPTAKPSANPTALPTAEPTMNPTALPTTEPTMNPTALPTTEPTMNPTTLLTADPTAVPTASPSAPPCVLWAVADYGETCSATCSGLQRVCKPKYFETVVTQEGFYDVIGSAVNVRAGGVPVGSPQAFCSQAITASTAVTVPAVFTIVLNAAGIDPVRRTCTYPTSAATDCDAELPVSSSFRRLCPCVDHNCDDAFYLGYSGDSCGTTCSNVARTCDAEKLSDIVDATSFSAMVATTTAVDSNAPLGASAETFCTLGTNLLNVSTAPAALTFVQGAVNQTLCAFPTSAELLHGDCDVSFTGAFPAQRFCNCRVPVGAAHRQLAALPLLTEKPVHVASRRLRGV